MKPLNRAFRNLLIYFFIVAVAAYFIYGGVNTVTYEDVGFTYFMQQLENKNVESVTIFERDRVVKES